MDIFIVDWSEICFMFKPIDKFSDQKNQVEKKIIFAIVLLVGCLQKRTILGFWQPTR